MDELELSYEDTGTQVDYILATFGNSYSDKSLQKREAGQKCPLDFVDSDLKRRIAGHILQARKGMRFKTTQPLCQQLENIAKTMRINQRTSEPVSLPELPVATTHNPLNQRILRSRFSVFTRLSDSHLAAALSGLTCSDMHAALIEELLERKLQRDEVTINLDDEAMAAITAVWNARRTEGTRTRDDRLGGLPFDCDPVAIPILHRYRGVYTVKFQSS